MTPLQASWQRVRAFVGAWQFLLSVLKWTISKADIFGFWMKRLGGILPFDSAHFSLVLTIDLSKSLLALSVPL
jgi:hypothetical protein